MTNLPEAAPTKVQLTEARRRIDPWVHRTPVLTSRAIDELTGATLFFKCENFQKVGAFKARGAANHVLAQSDRTVAGGVVTHSSGNHAQALALAARNRGVPAYIVMPNTAPTVKRAAVEGYGGRITLCEPTQESRESTARAVIEETGAHFVHPYNDPLIIAGQASAAAEVFEDVPDLDTVVAPVGGGGLLSGTALTARYLAPTVSVWGAEPQGAQDAFQSLEKGQLVPSIRPDTMADGLLTSLGDLTYPILTATLEGIGLCREESIAKAMRLLWERMKIIVEPSGAVPLAAILDGAIPVAGRRVAIILSGGNIDLSRVASIFAMGSIDDRGDENGPN